MLENKKTKISFHTVHSNVSGLEYTHLQGGTEAAEQTLLAAFLTIPVPIGLYYSP